MYNRCNSISVEVINITKEQVPLFHMSACLACTKPEGKPTSKTFKDNNKNQDTYI